MALGVCAPAALVAQQPAGSGYYGQSPAEMNAPRDPAEAKIYSAAVGEQDPVARQLALRNFLQTYPGSSLRQPAMMQLTMAMRQANGAGTQPAVSAAPAPKPSPIANKPYAAAAPDAGRAAAPVRDSMLQLSPTPAKVKVSADGLAIKANNSTLSQILHDIASSTGMKVDGLSKDERIFGTYGPGKPREVLSALLEGSGYNVLMVGDLADGAPRQLSLTQRPSGAGATNPPPAQPANEDASDDSDQDIQQAQPQEQNSPMVRPVVPTSQTGDGSQQPRTPQQIIQELQRMRQQQDQNPPQPPQN